MLFAAGTMSSYLYVVDARVSDYSLCVCVCVYTKE